MTIHIMGIDDRSGIGIPRRLRALTAAERIRDLLFDPPVARRAAPDPWLDAWQTALGAKEGAS